MARAGSKRREVPVQGLAISGDLVGSRRVGDRKGFQKLIEGVMLAAGSEFESDLIAPPKLTRGIDEFSALLVSPARAFDVLRAINEAIWPHRFRAGFGWGEVDVGAADRDAARMDGKAFHRAAAGLERAHLLRVPVGIGFAYVLDDSVVGPLEALADAHGVIVEGWSKGAAEKIRVRRRVETAVEVARELGIAHQAASDGIRKGRFDTLLRIEAAISSLLPRLPEVVDDGKEVKYDRTG